MITPLRTSDKTCCSIFELTANVVSYQKYRTVVNYNSPSGMTYFAKQQYLKQIGPYP